MYAITYYLLHLPPQKDIGYCKLKELAIAFNESAIAFNK